MFFLHEMNWLPVVLMSIKRWIKFERPLRAYCSNICILCPKLKKNNFSRSCCCRHLLEKLLRQQLRRSGVKPVLLEAPSSLWGCLQRLPTVELDVRKKGDDHDIGLSWVAATEAPQLKLGLVKVYIKLQTGKLEMYLTTEATTSVFFNESNGIRILHMAQFLCFEFPLKLFTRETVTKKVEQFSKTSILGW